VTVIDNIMPLAADIEHRVDQFANPTKAAVEQ
jgi:hypothetical protein